MPPTACAIAAAAAAAAAASASSLGNTSEPESKQPGSAFTTLPSSHVLILARCCRRLMPEAASAALSLGQTPVDRRRWTDAGALFLLRQGAQGPGSNREVR